MIRELLVVLTGISAVTIWAKPALKKAQTEYVQCWGNGWMEWMEWRRKQLLSAKDWEWAVFFFLVGAFVFAGWSFLPVQQCHSAAYPYSTRSLQWWCPSSKSMPGLSQGVGAPGWWWGCTDWFSWETNTGKPLVMVMVSVSGGRCPWGCANWFSWETSSVTLRPCCHQSQQSALLLR